MRLSLPAFAAFRHRDFALFAVASFLATVAMQMQAVAIGWQVYDITGRPFDLGLVGLAEFLPAAGLALIAGPVADRHDRRRVMLSSLGLEVLCAALLFALAISGRASLWPILGLAFLFGVARGFAAPASRALMPSLVPAEGLPNAVAWSAISWQIATIGGPALGGFIYLLGPDAVYASGGVALALAVTMIFMLRHRAARPAGPREAIRWADVVAGLHLIFGHKILLGAISLDLFAVLFGGAVALLPVYAKDILAVGPVGLGLLRAAPGTGAVITALALAQWPLRHKVGRTLFVAVALFGFFTVLFGLSESFPLSLAALAALGAADMVSVYIRGTLVPLATPDGLRGRVMAVEAVFIGASNELGAFESGAAAALLGVVPAVVLGGLATLLVAVGWTKLFPALAQVDRMDAESLGFSQERPGDRVAAAAGGE